MNNKGVKMLTNRFNFRAFIKPYNKIYKIQSLENDGTFMAVKCFEEDGETILKRNDNITDLPLFTEGEFVLMQATGLKDKNGKEIFECDVIKITLDEGEPYSRTCVKKVTWDDKNCCFLFGGEYINCMLYVLSKTTMEVIGNIYENKELLKKIKE